MVLEFPDCHSQIQNGEVTVYWKNDILFYREVHCNPQNQVESLYQNIRHVMNNHIVPNHLPLFTIDERVHPVLMVKCAKSDPFSKVKIDWCFQKVLVSYDSLKDKSAEELMYMTVELKKFVFSIVSTVVAFVVLPFRPILDVRYMYVGEDNNVVFTYYESRCQNHNWSYEAKELYVLFDNLGKNKARHSTTIREEIKSFGKSLINYTHQQLLGNPNLIFQNAIFWSVQMRIMFVIELHDLMEHRIISLHPTCANAFVDPNDKTAIDFREMMKRSNNPVLRKLLVEGDSDYRQKLLAWRQNLRNASPSPLRSDVLASNPSDVLEQGLTRIRDAYRHAFKNMRKSHSLEEIQHMFQHVFPKHMIEFGKLQSNLSFDVVSGVNDLLSAPSLESPLGAYNQS